MHQAMDKGGYKPYAILFVIAVFSLYFLRAIFCKAWRKSGAPPGPLALPIIGHLHLIRPPAHQAFHSLAERYGPFFCLRLGSRPCFVATTADTAREVLRNFDHAFANRPQTQAARRFAYDTAGFAFAPYGPYWRFMRRLCVSELLGSGTVDQLVPVRRKELLELLKILHAKSHAREHVNVSYELIKMTNTMIMRMMSGTSISRHGVGAEETLELVKKVNDCVGAFNLADLIGFCKNWDLQGLTKKIEIVHQGFDALMEKILKEREEARTRRKEAGGSTEGMKGLIDIMLDIAEDDSVEIKLTRENIKAFAQDIFTAGSDSSAATMEWALSELINHPDILDKVRAEIDEAIGKDRIVDESDISNLPYLQAVIKETLRLHPAAAFALRECIEDVKINNYDVPTGSFMFVSVWSINRDPNYWEEPLEFRPQRFMNKSDVIDFRGQNFRYLPFGSGRRVCPGINLALPLIQTTLAVLIQCFDWKIGDGKKLDMTDGLGVVIPRAHPIVCVPVARLDPLPSTDI